jgi:hypothetical protein
VVVSELVALNGTLPGARPALARAPAAPSPGSAEAPKPDPELAKVLRFSAKRQAG